MKTIRQGDLFFIPIDRLPADHRPVPGQSVLAHGEVTGHAHRIADIGVEETAIYEDGTGGVVVDARPRPMTVVHEEHGAVELSGLYRMERQREYDPDEAAREKRVQD